MAAEALIAVGLAFGERRVGEQRGRDRLQREADAELLHHVGFGRIIEVHLDRAGAEHHVEPEPADLRHVVEHDRVAALGHDRQSSRALVGPHAEAEEAEPEPLADRLALVRVPSRLGAGLVQVLERRAAQFELAGRLEADGAVRRRQRDDVAASSTGSQPYPVRPVRGRGSRPARRSSARVVGEAIDEFLVLGADAPVGRAASPRPRRPTSRSARLSIGRVVSVRVVRWRRLRASRQRRQHFRAYGRQKLSASRRRPPCRAASAARAAVSARRIRGPSEIATRFGAARISAQLLVGEPAFGAGQDQRRPGLKASRDRLRRRLRRRSTRVPARRSGRAVRRAGPAPRSPARAVRPHCSAASVAIA